jgi:hypothetical protein
MAAWDAIDVNGDNPFVPWRDRAIKPETDPSGAKPPGPEPAKGPPPGPPPTRRLPIQTPGGGDFPHALGFLDHDGQVGAFMIQLPGESGIRSMRPGETYGRWTFLGIEAGNVARFKDRDGRVYTSLIGSAR